MNHINIISTGEQAGYEYNELITTMPLTKHNLKKAFRIVSQYPVQPKIEDDLGDEPKIIEINCRETAPETLYYNMEECK